ncbi:hypothetical protein FXF51_05925 [Nonomuraea sp. PA05]|uniref:hypothetical protein n=1 Tax=Nonomuraea sp. PA05 TaxID=2604466 RepID=UPI0011DA1FC9|nr:hypothetical protein [Nonomuraea sp. PA05]TYB69698.1 hypothetical protein FXF51_05925 [Nonomuraea sp. PA05]
MASEQFPDRLLRHGYDSERTRARSNLEIELRDARAVLDQLTEIVKDDTATIVGSTAARLGRTVADLVAYANALDMANRLAFLCPPAPEEG